MAQLKVMISSTSRDLSQHRKEMFEACLRQGLHALRMEDLPARDRTAQTASVMLVNQADIYVGIFAHRYGYVPEEANPNKTSVTEMEYNHAVERGIPRLIFIIDEDHPIKISDVEQGEGALKLKTFIERVKTDNIVNFFKNPDGLRAEAINSLALYLRETAEKDAEGIRISTPPVADRFDYVSDVPEPPEVYIAHPYTLLQTHGLVGRQQEMNLLIDWVAKPGSEIYKAHILGIVAIGGMGKSALTWKWFEEIAPGEMKPLAGRMWWSFYESDATFENFIISALAYVSKRSIEAVREIPAPEREAQLFAALNREPHLIVLDGLERILLAYKQMDASAINDNEIQAPKNLRRTIELGTGSFLKKLAQVKCSRILLSTRLYPTELETGAGDPMPNVYKFDLEGLTDNDSLELWRAFGIRGPRDLLLPIFTAIRKHPLLIQALAGEVKRYKKAPGDFEVWRKNNPSFDPGSFPSFPSLHPAVDHVMEFALRELDEKPKKVLEMIASFRTPIGYGTLTALLVGGDKPSITESECDKVLFELEDRGLVGWDKRANRYDMHPIVRSVVWGRVNDESRQEIYSRKHSYFEAQPKIRHWSHVENLEDLTPAIEMYNTLIGMGLYDKAYEVFRDRLEEATLWRLSAARQRVELLEGLFPDGLGFLPRLSEPETQAVTLNALAISYQYTGQPRRAAMVQKRCQTIYIDLGNEKNKDRGNSLKNLADTLRLIGELRESEKSARTALVIARELDDRFAEAVSVEWLGLTLAAEGEKDRSERSLRRSLRIHKNREHRDREHWDRKHWEGKTDASLAQQMLWFEKYPEALLFANKAWERAHINRQEREFIRAARVQGEAALGLDDFASAHDLLHHALTRARAVSHVEEELPALTALAQLRRRQGDEKAAREFLDDVWEYAERGPYPLLHADALNVLAQIERDVGNTKEAIEAATKAYRLAWCDGPPYAYYWGLIKAEKHLKELRVDPPGMPPFDESKFEPMPEVEIDPDDEFHVGAGSED